jgi:hypothetical protein
MTRLQKIIDDYLSSTLSTATQRPDTLGGEPDTTDQAVITPEKNNQLRDRLNQCHSANSKKINIVIGLIVALVVLGIYLALKNSPDNYATIYGAAGIFAALIPLIKLLIDAVRDKVAMDILLTSQPDLSPQQFLAIVEAAATRLFK